MNEWMNPETMRDRLFCLGIMTDVELQCVQFVSEILKSKLMMGSLSLVRDGLTDELTGNIISQYQQISRG